MNTQLFDLTGKVALVTGASRGIGQAIAELFAKQGAYVIVSSRKQADCESVAQSIREQGGKAEAFVCHVGDLDAIDKLFAHIQATQPRLDILVNNAGTNPYFGHILDTDLAAYEKTVEVNFRGYFFMSTKAGQIMRKQKQGVIINTASVNAIKPGVTQGIYSITKAAVMSMTKAFAKECAPLGIRVNAILPGLTKTKLSGMLFQHEAMYKQLVNEIPMHRHAEPEEMAGTALYLASDASSYTTGACIVVDGGYSL